MFNKPARARPKKKPGWSSLRTAPYPSSRFRSQVVTLRPRNASSDAGPPAEADDAGFALAGDAADADDAADALDATDADDTADADAAGGGVTVVGSSLNAASGTSTNAEARKT